MYRPVIPTSGYTGWVFLNRTAARQQAVVNGSPEVSREVAYFRQKIGTIKDAASLVQDRRLLKVALTAFGLEGDLSNRAFIRKILEDGSLGTGALANRLTDKRYLALTKAFGFGDFEVPNTALSDFADRITGQYQQRVYEAAVGETDNDLRLALNARRELATLAAASSSDDTKWFNVIGSSPLRQVIQTALGLPSSFAAIDVDKQLGMLRAKAGAVLGQSEISQFADPAQSEKLIRLFLVRSQTPSSNTSPAAMALNLLR
jgi:hypothetical protein